MRERKTNTFAVSRNRKRHFQRSRRTAHKALFAFDNETSHAAFAADALVASPMNLGPGGKQPAMRDGLLPDGTVQSMVFPAEHPLAGQPKGIKAVLQERLRNLFWIAATSALTPAVAAPAVSSKINLISRAKKGFWKRLSLKPAITSFFTLSSIAN